MRWAKRTWFEGRRRLLPTSIGEKDAGRLLHEARARRRRRVARSVCMLRIHDVAKAAVLADTRDLRVDRVELDVFDGMAKSTAASGTRSKCSFDFDDWDLINEFLGVASMRDRVLDRVTTHGGEATRLAGDLPCRRANKTADADSTPSIV
eukprot:CAMPEP_0197421488 /NCGR_PEP_ID=MMETSP1170-20131217/8135_1 /TAXON_ID=54406 /ORGANISM="Sarcinochrysis sp, Strain CCMP770" /LENGTH=149 /DNA_ID=CAMNT_0042948735 /DNA_START=129 /DNA_END=579 /DNA_ORIENTATION=+